MTDFSINQCSNLKIIRDPNLAKNRIFVGNLPPCTREELESICHPYGKVLGSLVQKNFGFVQFETEEIANKVAAALTKSKFKSNIIVVRNAGAKQTSKLFNSSSAFISEYNDCEIIVLDRNHTQYAEEIEEYLKRLKLRVDVLFPNENVPIGKVLANISARGCLYAVVVTKLHQEHNSVTVNILQGQGAEHRNMPVEDAIKLIALDFRNKNHYQKQISSDILTKTVPLSPGRDMSILSLKESHPFAIQTLINLLASNMSLTVLQYDLIIKYLQERKQLQMKVDASNIHKAPDPELELQKKILNILSKPSIADKEYNLLYPSIHYVKEDYRLLELLKDGRVQKSLNSLFFTNLVGFVENVIKF